MENNDVDEDQYKTYYNLEEVFRNIYFSPLVTLTMKSSFIKA